jgi:hypothetical protein
VVSKIVVYLYSIIRRYKDQEIFSKKIKIIENKFGLYKKPPYL